MQLNEYQDATSKYRVSCSRSAIECGFAEEVGEVMGVLKRKYRGDYDDETTIDKLRKECGDVLWYMVQLLSDWDLQLEDVAQTNLAKLDDRLARKVLKGSGNDR